MQETRPDKTPSIFFHNIHEFKYMFQFLSIGEQIGLACLNTEALKTIRQLIKYKLLEEGIHVEPDCKDILKLYKEVHFKSVILLPLSQLNSKDKIDVFQTAKISKKTLFVDKIIEDY